jgi:photosystem II stability/assembly factor-like uncharacterized protein
VKASELDAEVGWSPQRARARRASALIAASVVVVALAGIGFVQPALPSWATHAARPLPASGSTYQVATVDFVSASEGWVAVVFESGDFMVLHTSDGGRTWDPQLSGPTHDHAVFLKFFDDGGGVFALVGARPLLEVTADGGKTWTSRPAVKASTFAISYSFIDSQYGWMLVKDSNDGAAPVRLFRTVDGGLSWVDLGAPTSRSDQAFEVQFSYLTTGWLTSANAGPYAYKSSDFGETWQRVALPAPANGWMQAGQYFVTIRPTIATGLVATVVPVAAIKGRTGIGGQIRAYPPLTVRAFDGGRPHTYTFTIANELVTGGPYAPEPAPDQVQLASLDGGTTWTEIQLPSTKGAVGYFDLRDWWWVGPGIIARSSDGGLTWSSAVGARVFQPLPGSLQVLDSKHAWLAASLTSPTLEATGDGGSQWRLVPLPPITDRY